MTLRSEILRVLGEVGFRTGEGPVTPFGQALPLVTGWGLDETTATIAFVVEDPERLADEDPWRELLFALSGLRHELRRGIAPALGTPVVLALLEDDEEALRLRSLVEELAREYVLFSRVELNAIVASDPVDLDRALAPLLPSCRKALAGGQVLGRELLESLAAELRLEISNLSTGIEPELRERGDVVAREYADRLAVFLDENSTPTGSPLTAWEKIRLTDFRSFEQQDVELAPFTLVDGLNGTGKSSLVEALEILWSGTTQRKPDDEADSFDKHLSRDGAYQWSVSSRANLRGDAEHVVDETGPAGEAIQLARNVLVQDSGDIAKETRERRYAELLRITGLAVPQLLDENEKINREAKSEVDRVLGKLGLPPLRAINVRATDHVKKSLAASAQFELPLVEEVLEAEAKVKDAASSSGLTYGGLDLGPDIHKNLATLSLLGDELAGTLRTSDEFVLHVHMSHESLQSRATAAEAGARALDALLSQAAVRAEKRHEATAPPRKEAPIPAPVATGWLHTGRAVRRSIDELSALREQVRSTEWLDRLDEFLLRAKTLIESVPFEELESMGSQYEAGPSFATSPTDPEVWRRANFSDAPVADLPETLRGALRDLAQALRAYSGALKELAVRVLDSPLVRLEGTEDDLYTALARFEIARQLKSPLTQAQETLLNSLIRGPLEPVLSELISALTRFEWYFHPFQMSVEKQRVRFGGLATPSANLDVRMLLNAGERAIVTIAWFLALHLLQRPERRVVLVLDDPFTNLDENNQAAFLATLRVFARLTRPQLLLLSCHDRTVADTIEREFANVEGWPAHSVRLRFSRSPRGTSKVDALPFEAEHANLAAEIDQLGLGEMGKVALAKNS